MGRPWHASVDTIFGHPAAPSCPPTALSPFEASGKIHHVLVRHEQCAAHMADGYARSTGASASVSPQVVLAPPTC
ncbi:MAG: thiamine pyrophosphate-binding protein [Caldilineaceae bacterium]